MTEQVRLSPSGPILSDVLQLIFAFGAGGSGAPIGALVAPVAVEGTTSPVDGVAQTTGLIQLVGDAALDSIVTLNLRIDGVIVYTVNVSVPANAHVPVYVLPSISRASVLSGPVALLLEASASGGGTVTVPHFELRTDIYNR